ncbi:hypothetical protein [Enterococcus gilvus]|uniref:hypothetical protein n=1 Tax=Enterococcus gilvus TaxID=160453 RepID=UPI0005D25ED2|nr:hypothetical protein [Enterococcus gilvus]MBS5821195.1 hypothetical protein [Enterococcus gilvus]
MKRGKGTLSKRRLFLLLLLIGVGCFVKSKSVSQSLQSGGEGTYLLSLPCKIETLHKDRLLVTSLEEIDGVVSEHSEITVYFTEQSKPEGLQVNERIDLRFLRLEKKGRKNYIQLISPNTIEKEGTDLLAQERSSSRDPWKTE